MNRISTVRALGAAGLAGVMALGALAPAAHADEPDSVSFAFPVADGELPLPVPADRILTVAMERDGEALRGVILLTDGGVIHFDGARSHPLGAPPADTFAALGK